MAYESLNVNGEMVPHSIIPIVGDGACLFRSISFLMYGTQTMAKEVREQIVSHVVSNWEEFSIMSHDINGDNYLTAAAYYADMSQLFTYGGLCELVAATQLFPFIFEVYRNGELYAKFGTEGRQVKRLRFTQGLSNGHFEAKLSTKHLIE